MIWEFWQSWTTRCDPIARDLGYLYESIAIKARAKRCSTAWNSHLNHTRTFLLSSARKCSQKRLAVILGSGWLLDVPLEELSREFEEVHLVDILHPKETVRRASELKNVRVLARDISGVAVAAHQIIHRARKSPKKPSLPEPDPFTLLAPDRTDFVASVNVLSQLPTQPIQLLRSLTGENNLPLYSEAELFNLASSIRERHLQFLRTCPRACLITDIEAETLHANNDPRIQPLVSEAKSIVADEEWMWEIAPPGEIAPRERTRHRVIACHWSHPPP